jgi:predicted nucleotidyltransferase
VKGFAKKLKLHDYQQKAISWMNRIENTADDEVDYVRLVPWNNVATDLLFETELKRVCLARDIPEFTKQMSHKGR